MDFKFKNSFKSIYVELIDMGVEKLIIGPAPTQQPKWKQ